MIEFARVGLLIVVLAFSVDANERAKQVINKLSTDQMNADQLKKGIQYDQFGMTLAMRVR